MSDYWLKFRSILILLLLWTFILGFRAWILLANAESSVSVIQLFYTISGDAILPGLCLIFFGFSCQLGHAFFKYAGLFFISVLLAMLGVDTVVQSNFNMRLSFGLLLKFYDEIGAVGSFINKWHVILPFFLIIFWKIHSDIRRSSAARMKLVGTCLCILGIFSQLLFSQAQRFSFITYSIIFDAFQALMISPQNDRYATERTKSAKDSIVALRKLELPEGSPNILLLDVESLSAVDSFKTSGIGHALDELDGLTSKGTLFKNLFANYRDSEGSRISLWEGFPPIPYPGSSRKLYENFGFDGSIFKLLKRSGYISEVILPGSKNFLGQAEYMRRMGVERYTGKDDVIRFQTARAFPWGASDDVLYEEAAERIGNYLAKGDKFFLTLLTASSHRPYIPPDDSEPNEENMFRYVAAKIVDFYHKLEEIGFFENGILLIIGDHRKWTNLSAQQEKLVYDESANSRVFGAVFGKGVKQNFEDARYIQQTELLFKLKNVLNPNAELSKSKLVVGQYSQLWKAPTTFPSISIFKSEWGNHAAKAFLNGTKVEIETPDGSDAKDLITQVEELRAFAQGESNSHISECGEASRIWGSGSSKSGLAIYRVLGLGLNQQLKPWGPNSATYLGNSSSDLESSLPLRQSDDGVFYSIGYLFPDQKNPLILRVDVNGSICVFVNGKIKASNVEGNAFGYGNFIEVSIPFSNDAQSTSIEIRHTHHKGDAPVQVSYWSKINKWETIPSEWLRSGKVVWH